MKSIERQREDVNGLLDLIKQNPDLEILPMVDTECVFSDDYSCWMAKWGEAKVDEYWCSNERVYFKEDDYDSLVEDWMDNYYEEYSDLSDEELERLAKEKVNKYEWIKAIVVCIKPI